MSTVLYLIRHGATAANLAHPPRLQGQRHNPPLAALGVRQAELTRDFLAIRPLDHCFCSPLQRAVETASIIALPHDLEPQPLEELTECDVGDWEGVDWQTIQKTDTDAYRRFMDNPALYGYPGGESFGSVYERASHCLETLLARHAGEAILVVSHDVVNRTYLAGVLGLTPDHAHQVTLDNCGISVVTRNGGTTTISTLNAAFHLQAIAA